MLSYMDYLNMPAKITFYLVAFFLAVQVIGELLELKGKTVPEFAKIRKYFARKKQEREAIRQMPEALSEVRTLLNDVNSHYNADNITKRDKWMAEVNGKLRDNDKFITEISGKIDVMNQDLTTVIIENKRTAIIDFSSNVTNKDFPATREQFKRIFRLHKEYEDIMYENDMTNGEVDIAFRIITEEYEERTKNHSFIEDIRW